MSTNPAYPQTILMTGVTNGIGGLAHYYRNRAEWLILNATHAKVLISAGGSPQEAPSLS